MARFDKKALMGIGTLIIFIATILVAAVAAAVLISTSNVLQQRALLVGQESRKTITNGIEVISILSASDYQTETFNNFEILIRLSPGSDALQMRNFDLQYTGPTFDQLGILAIEENQTEVELGVLDTTTDVPMYDMDDDGIIDTVRLVTDYSGTIEALEFNLSDVGAVNISLGEDLSAAGTTAVVLDVGPIGIFVNELMYGVVYVDGSTNTNDQIDASVNVTVREFAEFDECEFDVLPPEEYYCFKIMNGNDDYVLSSGERFKLLYKLTTPNEMTAGQDFSFIFATEKGRLSESRARTPDVITSTKTKLWPLG